MCKKQPKRTFLKNILNDSKFLEDAKQQIVKNLHRSLLMFGRKNGKTSLNIEICNALNIPIDNLRSVDIKLRPNQLPVVETSYYYFKNETEALVKTFQAYEIKPKNDRN